MLSQSGVLEIVGAWLLGVFIYPGLVFGMALVLIGDWLIAAATPIFTRRIYRTRVRPRHFLHPLYDIRKLAARRPSNSNETSNSRFEAWDGLQSAAPVLALALLPLPGNFIVGAGAIGDLFLVLALLVVQPLCSVLARLRQSDLAASIRGEHGIGRLLTGLFPTLLAVAALVQASGGRSLLLSSLSAAPETGVQAIVRLLAGGALLLSLTWWLDPGKLTDAESAGAYAGSLLQRSALAAFWSVLAIPVQGNLPWALFVSTAGTLFALIAMRLLQTRTLPTQRPSETARLTWAASLPVAALALMAALGS
jgi:hypothetical protein